jgi:hypothetical protein
MQEIEYKKIMLEYLESTMRAGETIEIDGMLMPVFEINVLEIVAPE